MVKYKGELQTDNGDVLYPCTSDDIVFGSDGKTVKEQIDNKTDRLEPVDYKLISDPPSAYKNGLTVFRGSADWVNGTGFTGTGSHVLITTFKADDFRIRQEVTATGVYLKRIYRIAAGSETWGPWQESVTTTQPSWITATLQNGWGGNVYYRKDSFGKVTVRGTLQTIGTTAPSTLLCSPLPSTHRPLTYSLPISVVKGNVSPYDISPWFNINALGEIKVSYGQTFPATGTTEAALTFEITYCNI